MVKETSTSQTFFSSRLTLLVHHGSVIHLGLKHALVSRKRGAAYRPVRATQHRVVWHDRLWVQTLNHCSVQKTRMSSCHDKKESLCLKYVPLLSPSHYQGLPAPDLSWERYLWRSKGEVQIKGVRVGSTYCSGVWVWIP